VEEATERFRGSFLEVCICLNSSPAGGVEPGLGNSHCIERYAQPEQIGFSSLHCRTVLSKDYHWIHGIVQRMHVPFVFFVCTPNSRHGTWCVFFGSGLASLRKGSSKCHVRILPAILYSSCSLSEEEFLLPGTCNARRR
jgi:hypothetical protein